MVRYVKVILFVVKDQITVIWCLTSYNKLVVVSMG
jgi:hypothetical protein